MIYIFIGLLLVFININVNGFDLLPNFIGFGLIAAGLAKLCQTSRSFAKAQPWALGMAIYSFLSYFAGIVVTGPVYVLSSLLNILALGAALYIAYLIVAGVGELEESEQLYMNSDKLILVWKLLAIVQLLCAILALTPLSAVTLIALPLVLGNIAFSIVFLVYFYGAKKTYDGAKA